MEGDYKYLFLAPEIKRNTPCKLLLVCSHKDGWDLDSFIKHTHENFDGVVVVDYSNQEAGDMQINICSNMLAYLKSSITPEDEPDNLTYLLSSINYEWACFMYSNEILYKLNHICSDIRLMLTDKTAIYQFNHIYINENNKDYLLVQGRENGILRQNRIFHVSNVPKKGVNVFGELSRNNEIIVPFIIMSQPTAEECRRLGINIFTKVEQISGLQFYEGKFRNYSSLTEEELQNIINNELNQISTYYLNRTDFLPTWGLYDGEAGVVLLLAQFFLKTNDIRYFDRLFKSLNYVIKQINSNMTYRSCCDLAWVGWLLNYIDKKNIIKIDEYYFSEIDSLLEIALDSNESFRWSYRNGRLGIIHYFMQRNNMKIVKKEFAILQRQIITNNGETILMDYNDEIGYYTNMGLEHGMAGILYFLGNCYEHNIFRNVVEKLGSGIITLYSNNENHLNNTFTYPHIINNDDAPKTKNILRFAWCYGAPGILYSIYLFCLKSNNKILAEIYKHKLMHTAKQRDIVSNKIYDAMICYGSAGLVQIYQRMYMFTKEEVFRGAAIFWLKVSVYISKDTSLKSGYKFWIPNIHDSTHEAENDSLLQGLAGVGLVYLSSFDYESANWDQTISL